MNVYTATSIERARRGPDAVPCRTCEALQGEPCTPDDPTSEMGRRMIEVGMPHMSRFEDYELARQRGVR